MKTPVRYVRLASAVAFCVVMTGCAAVTSPPAPNPGAFDDSKASRRSVVSATLRILVPRERRRGRLPRYVSPATQSLVATFTAGSGATAITTTFPVDLSPQTNPHCRPSSSGTTCMLDFELAPGPYTASFSTYDGPLDGASRPTGKVLSADIDLPVRIESGATLPVTLFGLPATVQVTSQTGALSGSQTAGFTILNDVTAVQQVAVVGLDSDGNAIVGPGAPAPALTTSDRYLKVTPPAAAAPNLFGVQVTGNPAGGHVASLSATLTPAVASGGSAVTSPLTVTFIAISLTEYPVPSVAGGDPYGIAAGPDGAMWFTMLSTGKIGRITTDGVLTLFPLPDPGSEPVNIAAGPDGAMWFTENAKIGRITTVGAITEYPIPSPSDVPYDITAGPDGNLWFTRLGEVDRMTTAGSVTEFPFAQPHYYITVGPDGALWFTGYAIGRITTAGVISQIPTLDPDFDPVGIASGSDGNLWYTLDYDSAIVRTTPTGNATLYPLPSSCGLGLGCDPWQITAGPDGALWFVERGGDNIGRITTGGSVAEFAIPTARSSPQGIAAGPDGAMWFTEFSGLKIGRLGLVR